jgi:hypothetical protein
MFRSSKKAKWKGMELVVDIPDMRTIFGSAVRCKMVMGCKVDDSKTREADSHVKGVNVIIHPQRRVGIGARGGRPSTFL